MTTKKITNILIAAGVILIAAFNPLSVVLIADTLVSIINQLQDTLVDVSNIAVIVGATVLVVGVLFRYAEYSQQKDRKETKRLKSLSKTEKAGKYTKAPVKA